MSEDKPRTTMKLVNCTQLAVAIGHHPNYVSAMKSAGYRFKYATRTTLAHALNWLEEHPDFRTTEYLQRRRNPSNPQPSTSGKSDEQA